MTANDLLTMADMARELGLHPSTLRHQRRDGHLTATKFGNTWVVTRAEAERYRRESLGQSNGGRPAKATS
jgi:excisionase family DNA binding protein